MSGSGNDFVFVNAMAGDTSWLRTDSAVRDVCDRRMGVGADGVVFLEESQSEAFRMVYLNSDGSRAAFCGNAALCSTRLAVELGIAPDSGFAFESDSGIIKARIHEDGRPEVELPPVSGVTPEIPLPLQGGEQKAGYTVVGVPHAVVLCEDVDAVELERRGPFLRYHEATSGGANVDFISKGAVAGQWRMRTYERGVEAETLACGSGAVASALLARTWEGSNLDSVETVIQTRSGLPVVVRARRAANGSIVPSLRGEGRIVFVGEMR